MQCNDKFLREMLHSPYGHAVAEAICTHLEGGLPVTITNGTAVKLTTREEALQAFQAMFHWTPLATASNPQIS